MRIINQAPNVLTEEDIRNLRFTIELSGTEAAVIAAALGNTPEAETFFNCTVKYLLDEFANMLANEGVPYSVPYRYFAEHLVNQIKH